MIRALAIALGLLLAAPNARANDPGGGAPPGGADVSLATTGGTATLSNGPITAVIQKTSGKVSSYLFNGVQMVDPANPIYYSMDGGASYDQPSNCVFSITSQSANMVDIAFKRTWNATAGYKHIFDIDLHYVLRRGDTGLYAYAILDHPAAYPAAAVGEWRIVWKLPRSSTTFTFERAYIDDLRHWEMPSYYDYQHASPTGIAEIVKLNTGVMAGKYDGKYTYAARYSEIGTWGHASNLAKKGVWFVLGGHDYFNDGPTKQDLTSSESYILMHFGRNHYDGSGISVAAGESWRKQFGPFLLYCNGTTAATNAGDALWADAKAQVVAEKAAWPYAWLASTDYPAAASRGTVTGRLLVYDSIKPALTGANANIGLAAPEDTHGNWQFQSKGYQAWTRADAAGNFTIPAVRPGSYTLYAFTDGVVGEFSRTSVMVTAGGTNALGNVTWNVGHPGTSIAWEIGVPDRTAREFRHGNDYFTPYLWDTYPQELPNPLVYTVGTSDPATAWNYVHSNYAGGAVPWDWNVKFSLPAVPRTGDATLTVAVASSNYARLFLYLNGETTSYARVSPPVDGGNALLRQGIHAKYSVVNIPIPVSRLRMGANTFTFRFSGTDGFSSHVMYDYLRLELPAFPPAPPSSGRSITWAGGLNAAANTWDNGATNSFTHNSASTAFGTGDAVTFNDAGSNSTGITLAGELEANAVTFTGAKNYTLTGSGSITGPISLFKSGGSTLTIAQANAYSGNTVISGGTVALANDTANGSGLGISDVTLENGTLKMYSNGATTSQVSSYWNLDVPSAATGTLEVDSRCDLRGKLTGSGIFRYKLPTGSVRASIFGDWSSFSGTIDATVSSGTADFRMSLDYNWPGLPAAALMLGPGVTAYYSGNLNQGAGTFISIGELSAGATATLKGGNIGGRALTYRIGGRGGDATFAGTFAEQASGLTHLIKTGGGVWTLSGSGNLNGDLTVEAGTLVLSGSFANPTERAARIGDSALLVLDGTLTTGSLEIADGGDLTGQGALVGTLHNDGLVELSTGSFGISGAVVNNGYFRVKSPAALSSSGPFENSGVLNLIGSSQPIPAGIVNTGVILTDRAPTSLTWSGSTGFIWDLQTSVNWAGSASQPAVFFPGDAVRFDDSAATTAIELAGTLAPASVTVDASVPYTISGGAIGGSASLTKSGSGELTVSSALQATGPVTGAGGTLAIATAAAWPATAPLIEVQAGATLDVSALATGATIAAGQTLRGGGAVTGNVSISGNHDPAPGASFAGNLGYASSARVSWALNSNATSGGAFDTISAGAVTIAAGALLELVFDGPGSTVDFLQPFWSAGRSWTILTASTRTGTFILGAPGNDPQSRSPAAFGTFSLVAAGTALVLTWVPTPIIAIWQGATSSDWDHTTPNWWRTGSAAIFQNGFTALLDDSAASTAINLVETVAPAALIVDSTKNYTISGGGTITGVATLEKKRSGTLTLATAHGFTGGTTIDAGTVAIGNAGSLGTGPITLAGGTLATGALTPLNSIVVTADSTISGGSGGGLQGVKAVSGSGTLTLHATNVFDLEGSLAGFAGRVYLSGTSTVRLNGCTGSALATFDLGTRTVTARAGTSFNLGALAGLTGAILQGSSGSGNTSAVTYTIGANRTDSVLAGAISNGAGATSIIKAGSGTLTLSGSNTYTGSTTVNAGSLSVTGSLATTPVTVNSTATLTGTGTLAGSVKLSGTLAPGPGSGTLRIASLEMSPSAVLQLEVGPASDRIITSGDLSLSGTLRVSVAPDTTFGRFPLILHGGVRTGSIALAGLAPGTTAHLSTATPDEVTLFLDDSDEDGLPDSWEQSNFGSLTSAPGDDPDGDGTNNLTEFRLGLKPTDGSSAFTATGTRLPGGFTISWPTAPEAVFEIQRSTSVTGPWTLLNKVVGAGTYTDPAPPPGRAFYRVALVP